MKRFIASLVMATVLFAPALSSGMLIEMDDEYRKGALLKFVENSELVVVGRVFGMMYVSRPNILPDGGGVVGTDITVWVETLIKGKPNVDENHVRFMVQGGLEYSEVHGEMLKLSISGLPEFKMDEKVLLFLSNDPCSVSNYYAKYPHGGYHVLGIIEGKKEIKDDKVRFGYLKDPESLIGVYFPLELAVNIGKAFVKDEKAAIALEEEIKALAWGNAENKVVLPKALVKRLMKESQEIIDKKEYLQDGNNGESRQASHFSNKEVITILTTVTDVADDIIENMSEADKANVVNTSEDDLVLFHHGWGTGIRNHYNLWRNKALVDDTGAEHPDDASMVIIKAVWQALRDSGKTYRQGKIDTTFLHWHENEQCLEISADARSIVIEGIDFDFAQALTNTLRMQLISSASYMVPEVAPLVMLQRNVVLKVWKYPKHPDNQ